MISRRYLVQVRRTVIQEQTLYVRAPDETCAAEEAVQALQSESCWKDVQRQESIEERGVSDVGP